MPQESPGLALDLALRFGAANSRLLSRFNDTSGHAAILVACLLSGKCRRFSGEPDDVKRRREHSTRVHVHD